MAKRKRKKRPALAAVIILALALVCGAISRMDGISPTLDGGEARVHFIDVGQADSILVETAGGKVMLIDAGNNDDGELVADYISGLGISHIDYIIGTHPHEDHIGGMDYCIENFDIGEVYMPEKEHTTKTFRDVLTAVGNKGLTIQTAAAGVEIFSGGGESAEILAPVGDDYEELNNWSAVIKYTCGEVSFLFMGDSEELVENEITADVSADVLKVGHHGSDTSTSESFLKRVSPEYAVISVGAGNSYSHPSETVLSRLEAEGAQVLRTDLNGTVVMTTDGKTIEVDTEK